MAQLHIRRATVDDLPALLALWASAQLPARELESRLTEFQVVEADGEFAGALGIQVVRQHARLHSEDYSNFAVADAARELFWERIQKIASNHGVFRLWTQETSPFWTRWGFQPADPETLGKLPPEWQGLEGRWLTYELKNEAVITTALGTQFADFMAGEQQQTAKVSAQARRLRLFITIFFFALGIGLIAYAIYLLKHHPLRF
jgi:N-acetylglutamate synthase-like GNAT family acetyltransferase